jgi:uncharacterized protein (DUF2141 family)
MHKQTMLGLAACFVLAIMPARAADSGDLTVHVTGLKNNSGLARVAVFNSPDAFAKKMDPAAAFRKDKVPVANQEATVVFKDLPYGDYAVKYFHDEDGSGDFKTNMLGIPKVEFGFSNDAKAPPKWDQAKFSFGGPQMTIEIKTQHAL